MDTNTPDTTIRSRALRKAPSPGESYLWKHLRSRQLAGAKFRRQMPVGPYFADFACTEFRCIIEIDGSSHEAKETYDFARDEFMAKDGWKVLRFTEAQVRADLEAVLQAIACALDGE